VAHAFRERIKIVGAARIPGMGDGAFGIKKMKAITRHETLLG
jgi:hypothetical protein